MYCANNLGIGKGEKVDFYLQRPHHLENKE